MRRVSAKFVIRRKACTRTKFSGCSSTTNAHSETGQMAVCCQNLTLGALSSRSALSVLVGALFKEFGLFLNRVLFCSDIRHLAERRVLLSPFYIPCCLCWSAFHCEYCYNKDTLTDVLQSQCL
jgi:hypothetical protein